MSSVAGKFQKKARKLAGKRPRRTNRTPKQEGTLSGWPRGFHPKKTKKLRGKIA